LDVDPNHLFILTEAAEQPGLVTVEKGDINLTSLGETFAKASILARKEISAARIRGLPLICWLTILLAHLIAAPRLGRQSHRVGCGCFEDRRDFLFQRACQVVVL
jgi:hypothetical protein